MEIDSQGRTAAVHIDQLSFGDAYRSDFTQSRIGDLGGQNYDGGHLAANVSGGGAENINMVAMLREINRGSGNSYFNLENRWRALLNTDPPPAITVSIEPMYSAADGVPSVIHVNHSINGLVQRERAFENVI